jgi:hypothetical protein
VRALGFGKWGDPATLSILASDSKGHVDFLNAAFVISRGDPGALSVHCCFWNPYIQQLGLNNHASPTSRNKLPSLLNQKRTKRSLKLDPMQRAKARRFQKMFDPLAFDSPWAGVVFVSELRTKWFPAYRAAMGETDSHEQPRLMETAIDLMRRRGQQIATEHGSHVEKHLMMDAMARLEQRWDHRGS